MSGHPFTETELRWVFQLITSEEQAEEMMREALNHAGGFLDFTQDTLVLLSLKSEATRAKVERYIQLDDFSPELRAQWNARREQLKEMVE